MREAFRKELEHSTDQLVEMTRLAGSAMARATTALLDADISLAESVIAADEQIDRLQREFDENALTLLAQQQPVATDLRVIVSGLRMSADLERMGDLARHIAKIARRRHPQSAVPPMMRSTVLEMGQVAERIVAKAGSVIATNDVDTAIQLEQDDDDMDRLHRQVFTLLLSEEWCCDTEAAIDITLVSRYYERYADHAVSVARRVVFLVTGAWAER